MWAFRLDNESRSHSHNTFLTLTYDEKHEPAGLMIPHMQKFWKRLRRQNATQIKTFYCGEYGDRTRRPHYHAAVFGMTPFEDAKKWDTDNDVSDTLNKIWGMGRVTISEANTNRYAYVAGYVLKKAGYRKQVYCDEDGVELQKPFRRMSQGLGKQWLNKYATDLRNGYALQDGRKTTIPRYYLDRIEKDYPELAEQIATAKEERRASLPPPDPARGRAAEEIRRQQIKQRQRDKI